MHAKRYGAERVTEPGKVSVNGHQLRGLRSATSSNYSKYLERGGMVNPVEDASGFAAGGQGDAARFFFFCLMQDQLPRRLWEVTSRN